MNCSSGLLARQQLASMSCKARPEADADRPSGYSRQPGQDPVQGPFGRLPGRETDFKAETIGRAQLEQPASGEQSTLRSRT